MKKLLTVVCLLTLLGQQCFAGTLNWSSPATISTPSVDANDPQIVIDVNGNATSVWTENSVVKASHFPTDGSWGTITSISNSGASSPRIGVDSSGNVTAVWLANGVVTTATLPAGGSWSTAKAISNTGASSISLNVDRSGNAVAVWVRNGFIETAQKPFGTNWSNVSLLTLLGTASSPNVYIGSNGTIFAVWNLSSSGIDTVAYAKGSVGGVWGASANILSSTPSLHHNYPRVVVDQNGNATAVWYRYNVSGINFSNVNVLAATLNAGSTTWGSLALLSNPGLLNVTEHNFIRLGIDAQGNIMAQWLNSYDGDTLSIEANTIPFSGSWQTMVSLDSGDPYLYQGTASVAASGDSVVAFMEFDGTNLNIQAQETCLQGVRFNQFTFPATISSGTNNAYPRVSAQTLNNQMNAASVWLQNNGLNTLVQAAIGSKALLPPPSNLMVAQISNDFGVFSEFVNTLNWTASPDPDVIEYVVYRNNIAIATTPASQLQFVDHNAPVPSGSITYGVAAMDSLSQVSQIIKAVE